MKRPRSTETEEKRDGGEARAVGGLQEEEDGEREKNEEGRGMPIYKEKCEQTGAKIEGEPNNVIQLHRRLDSRKTLRDKDPLRMTS